MSKNNYFEDIVNEMMLDEVCGDDNALRAKINTLDNQTKRLFILGHLDDDRNLFSRIVKIINDTKSCDLDHVNEVINMLRKYVKVGDVEKKKYGEVMTPLELVKEMGASIPKDFWKNPNSKILDPCNGTGPFLIYVIFKLMFGLKDWEKDEEKRYRHIVENMIYACELQSKNMFLWLCLVDPQDTYNCNVFTGSFLSKEFDDHMKNEWEVESWNLILGNPPYNSERGDTNVFSKDLYNFFVDKSVLISNYVLMITPSRWFIKEKLSEFRFNMLNKYGLKFIKHFDDNKFFENADIKGGVSYFLIEKNYKDKIIFNNEELDLKNINIIPLLIKNEVFSIIDKVSKFENIQKLYNVQGTFGTQTNDKNFINFEQNNYIKCHVSKQKGNIQYFPLEKLKNIQKLKKIKITIPAAVGKGGFNDNFYNRIEIIEENEICSKSFIFFDFDDMETAINFKKYLETKFFSFLVRLMKNTQDNKKNVFEYVPIVDFNKEWTDEKLYKYFNLTQEEVDLIENTAILK